MRLHLFEPEQNRYAPRPFDIIKTRIPIGQFFRTHKGNPLKECVFEDFNGDGKTDLGFLTAENVFSAWLISDTISKKPDFTERFPEAITQLLLRGDIDSSGRTSLVMRGKNNLYILTPPKQ